MLWSYLILCSNYYNKVFIACYIHRFSIISMIRLTFVSYNNITVVESLKKPARLMLSSRLCKSNTVHVLISVCLYRFDAVTMESA